MRKLLLILATGLIITTFLAAGCGEESVTPTTGGTTNENGVEDDTPVTTGLAVENAAEARDTAIDYLHERGYAEAPDTNMTWQEEDTTPDQLVGASDKVYTSGDWSIGVSYPVVLLENTIYTVKVRGNLSGWSWEGRVNAYGEVTEITRPIQITEETSREMAEEFVRNSPTFQFDGMPETLVLTGTMTARCPFCWVYVFEFDSRQGGYGDRTGQMLIQVITHHRAVIAVEQMAVTSAVMDETWDMLRQVTVEAGAGREVTETR